MQKLSFLWVLFALTIGVLSCKKDKEMDLSELQTPQLSLHRSDNDHNFFQNYLRPELCYEPHEMIDEIILAKQFIAGAENVSPHYLDYIETIYGSPLWDAGTIVRSAEDNKNYVAIIPLIYQNKANSLFTFIHHHGKYAGILLRLKEVETNLSKESLDPELAYALNDFKGLFEAYQEHLFCSDALDNRFWFLCDISCPSPAGSNSSSNGCGILNFLFSWISGGNCAGCPQTPGFFGSGAIGGTVFGFDGGAANGAGGAVNVIDETPWGNPDWMAQLCSIVAQDAAGILEDELDPASIDNLFQDIDDEIYNHCLGGTNDEACNAEVRDYFDENEIPKCIWFDLNLNPCCAAPGTTVDMTTIITFEECADKIIEYDEKANILFNEIVPNYELSMEEKCRLWNDEEEMAQLLEFSNQDFADINEAMNWLIDNDPKLQELSQEMAAAPSWMWPFIRELAIEVVVELLKKRLNLQLSDELQDALEAISQGDLYSFMAAAIDIISEVHPATKGLKAIWDTTILGKQALKAWDAIKKLEEFGGDFIDKFFDAMHNVAGGILGKIRWQGHPYGAIMPENIDAYNLIDDLAELFGKNIFNSWGTNTSIGQYQFEPDCCGIKYIRIYYDSNTTGPDYYTLLIRPEFGEDFKIRFTD